MFEIGQILTKENYTRGAIWCNANGAHIEQREGRYVIAQNAPLPEPSGEEQVKRLEDKYSLPRPVRTALLLAREAGQDVDSELMARVDEIEALAAPLRAQGEQ